MRINVTIDTSPQYLITLEEVKRIAQLGGHQVPTTFIAEVPRYLSQGSAALWCEDIGRFLRNDNIEKILVTTP